MVIAARTLATLQIAADEITAETGQPVRIVAADLSTDAGRDAALTACAAPDILVNNADGPLPGDFRDWTRHDWHVALDAMMLGPIEMIRRTVDTMIDRKFGRIVNIVSRSVKTPDAALGLSGGARSGLVGVVAGLARQTVRHNVTINNLLPGAFATDAQRRHTRKLIETTGESFETVWMRRGSDNPAGRFGQAEEIGALCAFVCSAHAGYITGQSILIDGGAYPGTF